MRGCAEPVFCCGCFVPFLLPAQLPTECWGMGLTDAIGSSAQEVLMLPLCCGYSDMQWA